MIKLRGHYETKPPIEKNIAKIKTNQTLFCNVPKIIVVLICKQSLPEL